jgi:hypothetical protein
MCQQVGLPLLSFVLLGTYGLQQLLSSKYSNLERKKTYVQPEAPEEILKVIIRALPRDKANRSIYFNGMINTSWMGRKCKKSWQPKIPDLAKQSS